MRSPMDEKTFLDFYKNTVLGCSKAVFNHICTRLVEEHRITLTGQTSIDDSANILWFDGKKDLQKIISETASNKDFSGFYEEWEFSKLYKYSVPLFYELPEQKSVEELFAEKGIKEFISDNYCPEMVINTSLKDSTPMFWKYGENYLVKFVLQKSYYLPDTFDQIDYRYPIVFYFDTTNSVVEIRYDATKYARNELSTSDGYEPLVADCISWLQKGLGLQLYVCEHSDFITIISDKQNEAVRIYKQMMELSSGGSAELTASESADYILPFIGEIKELIEEHDVLFNKAEDIKKLLLQYLADKEETASYPYIYVKWVKPVESQSYIVKVTFEYLSQKYTLLQHITGSCKDLGMGRMNDAIKYLCESRSFVKGETV